MAECAEETCTAPAKVKGRCRPCYTKKWNRDNRDRNRVATRKWRAKPDVKAAMSVYNAEYMKTYCVEHPEVIRAARRRRRAAKRAAPGSHTAAEFESLLARYAGRCAYCGQPATSRDHVVALAAGGSDSIDNLVPACGPCNSSKGDRDVMEWLEAVHGADGLQRFARGPGFLAALAGSGHADE